MAKKTTTKTPKGRKVIRLVQFSLTATQHTEKSIAAAKFKHEVTQLEFERTKFLAEINPRIKAKHGALETLLKEIYDGTEKREVECIEHKNYNENKVEFFFEGKIVDTRKMDEADRQQDFEEMPLKKNFTKGKKTNVKPSKESREAAATAIANHKKKTKGKKPVVTTTTEATLQ